MDPYVSQWNGDAELGGKLADAAGVDLIEDELIGRVLRGVRGHDRPLNDARCPAADAHDADSSSGAVARLAAIAPTRDPPAGVLALGRRGRGVAGSCCSAHAPAPKISQRIEPGR